MNSSNKKGSQILGVISEAEAQRLLLDLANTDPWDRNADARKRLLRRHPEIFADLDPSICDETLLDDPTETITPERRRLRGLFLQVFTLILNVVTPLRDGWNASDPRRRDWFFVKARLSYASGMERLFAALQELLVGHQKVSGVMRPNATRRSAYPLGPFHRKSAPGEPPFSYRADTPDDLSLMLDLYLLSLEVPLTPFDAAMFHLQTHLVDRIRRCPNPECPAPFFIAAKRSFKYCSSVCAAPAQREFKKRWWRENRGVGAKKASVRIGAHRVNRP